MQAQETRSMRRWWGLAMAVLLGGCETVRPWQRGPLAHRQMRAVVQIERELSRGHFIAVREAAQGGQGGAGGGCGCD